MVTAWLAFMGTFLVPLVQSTPLCQPAAETNASAAGQSEPYLQVESIGPAPVTGYVRVILRTANLVGRLLSVGIRAPWMTAALQTDSFPAPRYFPVTFTVRCWKNDCFRRAGMT